MTYLKIRGFTLIEIVIFIVISGIIMGTILLAGSTGLLGAPASADQIKANLLARQCMEYLLGNRDLNGFDIYTCPSTPSNALCASITGFTVTPSVTCTTLGSDTSFKTFTVVISGNGDATLRTLIADY